jgi:hypothetical protein
MYHQHVLADVKEITQATLKRPTHGSVLPGPVPLDVAKAPKSLTIPSRSQSRLFEIHATVDLESVLTRPTQRHA